MSLNNSQWAEKCWDETVRIEQILFLGGQPEHPSEELKNLLEDIPKDLAKDFGFDSPEDIYKKYSNKDDWDDEDEDDEDEYYDDFSVEEFINDMGRSGKMGFIVSASSPVMKKGDYFSWGYYMTCYAYADDIQDAIASAFEKVKKARVKK